MSISQEDLDAIDRCIARSVAAALAAERAATKQTPTQVLDRLREAFATRPPAQPAMHLHSVVHDAVASPHHDASYNAQELGERSEYARRNALRVLQTGKAPAEALRALLDEYDRAVKLLSE